MADQVVAQLSLTVTSTNFNDNKNWDLTDTLAKQALATGIQIITTDYAAVTIGDMASTDQGLLVLHNLDTDNYVLYGSTDGEWTINAGEFAIARLTSGKTISAKAPTAQVNLEKYLLGE